MRNLTTDFKNELVKASIEPVELFEWTLASSTIRLWSGINDVTWNSETWNGNGWYKGFDSIKEVGDIEAVGIQIALSGVPQSLISTILDEARQGGSCSLYFGFLNSSNTLIVDPYNVYMGRFDTAELSDDPLNPSIIVNLESVLIDLDKSKELLLTNEAQKALYPDDKGLEYVNTLQDSKWYWGRKATKKKKNRRVNR